MSSKFEEFRQNFVLEVEAKRTEMGEGLRKSFVACMSEQIPDEEADNITPVYLDEHYRQKRVAVDGYAYNGDEHTLVLVIADWNEFASDERLTKTQADALIKRTRAFFELSLCGRLQEPSEGILEWSSPEYGLADLINTETIDRVRILLYTDRLISDKFKKLGNQPIDSIAVSEEVWGFERLFEYFCSTQDHEALELSFRDSPIPLTLATKGDGFKSYLGVIAAPKLAAIYREHGGRLLEGNVRSYLTLRSAVNRDILRTIKREPEHFFIYNNGIAVTARDLVFNGTGELIAATDFQIINGGQTTASLASAFYTDKADINDIQISIKLTEIDKDLDEAAAQELIRNISRFSNNQNKVSGADFSSNHEFHVRMEQYAQRLPAPPAPGHTHGSLWFYERNRGSYLQAQMFLSAAKKKIFTSKTDKNHVVKKEDLAQVRLAWDQRPDLVSKGKAALFSKFMDELDGNWAELREKGIYGEDYFRDSISLVILFRELRDEISHQTWYSKGYLANITNYAISVFSWLFQRRNKGKQFNFNPIWQKQSVPQPLMQQLLEIAREVKDCLLDPERTKENVTEWAKMNLCWQRVKAHFDSSGYELPDDVDVWIRSKDDIAQSKKEGKELKKTEDFLDITSQAINYPHGAEALAFAEKVHALTPQQEKCIRRCTMMPNILPSERELKKALEGLESLRSEGFRL